MFYDAYDKQRSSLVLLNPRLWARNQEGAGYRARSHATSIGFAVKALETRRILLYCFCFVLLRIIARLFTTKTKQTQIETRWGTLVITAPELQTSSRRTQTEMEKATSAMGTAMETVK